MVHELSAAGVQRVLLPRQPAANWDDNALATTALADTYVFVSERQVGVWPVQLHSHPPARWRTLGNALGNAMGNTMGGTEENTFQNGLQLRGFALSPTRLTANGLLVVNLAWQGETIELTGSEKVFVQLLNSAGQLVAQDDRPFSYPNATPNATIEHQTTYGILLPTTLSPGTYRLIAGLYDPAVPGSPRLLTNAGADFVDLTILSAEGED